MARLTDSRRRWTGAIFLGIALLMLILGLTVLEPRLKNFDFILYWLICFAFTLSAASVALLDIVALKERSREEQRGLIEDTLKQIEREAEDHQQDKDREKPDRG